MVLLPLLVVVVPATRFIPTAYRFLMRSRIYKWYGALMSIERQMLKGATSEEQANLVRRAEAIEKAVNELKMPVSYAEQLFVLRDHVRTVHQHLRDRPLPGSP